MPIDWKLNNELNKVWHFSFWLIILLLQPKNWIPMAKKELKFLSIIQNSDFCQKFDIFFLSVPKICESECGRGL